MSKYEPSLIAATTLGISDFLKITPNINMYQKKTKKFKKFNYKSYLMIA
jgi:hypothetical protein